MYTKKQKKQRTPNNSRKPPKSTKESKNLRNENKHCTLRTASMACARASSCAWVRWLISMGMTSARSRKSRRCLSEIHCAASLCKPFRSLKGVEAYTWRGGGAEGKRPPHTATLASSKRLPAYLMVYECTVGGGKRLPSYLVEHEYHTLSCGTHLVHQHHIVADERFSSLAHSQEPPGLEHSKARA